MSGNNFEDLERKFAPDFFVKSAVNEERFRFQFWIGPDSLAAAIKLKQECNADTTRYHVDPNQAAQEMFVVDTPFPDADHENFYQYCIGNLEEHNIQYLFDPAENMWKRWEGVEGDLTLAEKEYVRFIDEEKLMAEKEKVKQFLRQIEEHRANNNLLIDKEIAELERKRERLHLEYESKKDRLQKALERIEQDEEGGSPNKQQRLSGLYCAQCHPPP